MKFTKMEGLGNDFVVLEGADPTPDQVRALCDRRRGIGADGVLVVDPLPGMRYWNSDGSQAEMCGNGLRCVAWYAVQRGWMPAGEWTPIVTAVGQRRALVEVDSVTVELGPVQIGGMLEIDGRTFHEVSIGNPHAVTLVGDPDEIDVASEGPRVAADVAFPEGVNVEYVADLGDNRIRMRVWERGVGETLACGTGMVVAAAVAAGVRSGPVQVVVPGGTATVSFEADVGYLQGPANVVFSGEMAGSP